jgi:hypothetical protein
MMLGLGGISAIAIWHPHYDSSLVEWNQAFGGVRSISLSPTATG